MSDIVTCVFAAYAPCSTPSSIEVCLQLLNSTGAALSAFTFPPPDSVAVRAAF